LLEKNGAKIILSVTTIFMVLCLVVSISGCILARASAEWVPNTVAVGGTTDGYIYITNLSPITLTVTEYVDWVRDPDGLTSTWTTGLLGASRECEPLSETMIVHVIWGIALTAEPGTYTYHYTITFTDGQEAYCDATITITPQ